MADGAVTHPELQKPEVISQHEEAVRRIIRSSTLELSHHLHHSHGEHHLFQTSTSDGNASVAVSLQNLRPISLSELEMDTVHHGRVLKGTLCVDPFFMLHTIVTVLEDARDSSLAARLAVHNILEESMASLFPIGAHVAVKEPFLTRDDDGLLAIRVDNAANVQKLSENGDDDEAGAFLLDDDDDDEYDYSRKLRERGNKSVSQGNWSEAIDCYSKCLFTMLKEREKDGRSDDSQELDVCEDMEKNMLYIDLPFMWYSMADENKGKAIHIMCKYSTRTQRNNGLHQLIDEYLLHKLIKSLVMMFLLNSINGQLKLFSLTRYITVDCTLSSSRGESSHLSRCTSKFRFIIVHIGIMQHSMCSGTQAKFFVMEYKDMRDISGKHGVHHEVWSRKECKIKPKAYQLYKFKYFDIITKDICFSEMLRIYNYICKHQIVIVVEDTEYFQFVCQTSKQSNDDIVQVSSAAELPLSFNETIVSYTFGNYSGLQSDIRQSLGMSHLQGSLEPLPPLQLVRILCILLASRAQANARTYDRFLNLFQVECLEIQNNFPSLILFGISEMSLAQLCVTKSLLAEHMAVSVYLSLKICNMVSEWLIISFLFSCHKCYRQCSVSAASERLLFITV